MNAKDTAGAATKPTPATSSDPIIPPARATQLNAGWFTDTDLLGIAIPIRNTPSAMDILEASRQFDSMCEPGTPHKLTYVHDGGINADVVFTQAGCYTQDPVMQAAGDWQEIVDACKSHNVTECVLVYDGSHLVQAVYGCGGYATEVAHRYVFIDGDEGKAVRHG